MDDTMPHLVRIAGRPCWRFADGRLLALLAGGDDGEEGDGEEGDAKPPTGDDPAAKARREAADLRRRLKATEAERDQLKAAQQTDAERLAARAEAAEGTATKATERARALAARLAILEAAPGLGIVDPKLAARLVDVSSVEYDDDGEPNRDQVRKQLEALVEEHPHLTRSGDADTGRRDKPAEGTGKDQVNAWLRGEAPAPTRS